MQSLLPSLNRAVRLSPSSHLIKTSSIMASDTSESESRMTEEIKSQRQGRSRSPSSRSNRKRSASPVSSLKEGENASNVSESAPVAENPPLPDEEAPPLPDEAPPVDDGWDAMWDEKAQAYYFYNRYTRVSQWENPRVPEASTTTTYGSYDRYPNSGAPGTTSSSGAPGTSSPPRRRAGGYNPAIHGSYDPNADYAVEAQKLEEEEHAAAASAAALAAGLPDPNADYAATANFNRFTGRFQHSSINPDNHNDENKSNRQMSAYFDVDKAANSHDGRSLKAERRGKNLSKQELKAYKEKRRDRKEEKRRAWLRD